MYLNTYFNYLYFSYYRTLSVAVTCSVDGKPLMNGEHPAAESSQDADADADESLPAAADDSQLATANDTSAFDVTADTVTVHVM